MYKRENKSYLIINFKKIVFVFLTVFNSCKPLYNSEYKKPKLVDNTPSKRVEELHKKLFYISKEGFAIGHQDATSYGIDWKQADNPNIVRSDVYDIIGDFPAVYGFDISKIEVANDNNIDGVPFLTIRELIIDAYSKGGIITISWHADNPISGRDSWDKSPAVKDIIGNGVFVEKYDLWIEKVARFFKTLKYKGKLIPILFRPFHEMNGDWFWWGNPNCTSIEYIQLWRNTVYSLRDVYELDNLLYVYAPNKLRPDDDYMEYYPGDNFVDVFGIDIYDFKNSEDYMLSVVNDLKIVKEIAATKNKLYAFTETGLEAIPNEKWFSQVLYPNIENSGIAWILFWRNDTKIHHYLPYKAHVSEVDFKEFSKLPKTLFLKDINNLKF
tara:strand:- start:7646 stop:8794 length:1149 start_codon:yes stop_codon:yes gene_type:complete